MNPKPKIVVLRMREIIYTLLLLCLIILLVVCLFFMFAPSSQKGQRQPASENLSETSSGSETSLSTDLAQASSRKVSEDALYTAGVYTSPVALGTSSAEVEVTVDTDEIRSIRLIHLSEAAEAMYPLAEPSMDRLAAQILETQKLEGITCPQEEKYTSQLLLNAVSDALSVARISS